MNNILDILGIPLSIMLFGTRLMRRMIYESLLKKAFKLYNRNRKIKRLKKFLKIKERED